MGKAWALTFSEIPVLGLGDARKLREETEVLRRRGADGSERSTRDLSERSHTGYPILSDRLF